MRGIDMFFDVGWTEKGSFNKWFWFVDTWWSIRGYRKDNIIYSSMNVNLQTLSVGFFPFI